MLDLIPQQAAEGGGDPVRIARLLRITTEGVWLDMMTMTDPYDAAEAMRTTFTCAAAFFPRLFDENGLVGGGRSGSDIRRRPA